MTDLAKLVVRLEAEAGKYEENLDKAHARLKKFEGEQNDIVNKLTERFAELFAADKLLEFGKGIVELADTIGSAAERIGTTADELSKLAFVAKENSVAFESLEMSLKVYLRSIANAADGQGEAVKALQMLKLSAEQLRSENLTTQLSQIAERFSMLSDPAARAQVAQELFGRSGNELIPILRKGAAGIDELIAKAEQLGITLDQHAVKSIDRSTKALNSFWDSLKSRTANAVGSLIADFAGTSGDKLADLNYQLKETMRLRDEAQKREDERGHVGRSGQLADRTTGISMDRLNADITSLKKEIALLERIDYLQTHPTRGHSRYQFTDADEKQFADAGKKYDKEQEQALAERLKYLEAVDQATIDLQVAFGEHINEINKDTLTIVEKESGELGKRLDETKELLDRNLIDYKEYVARRSDILDKALPEFKVTLKKTEKAHKESVDKMSEYWVSAQHHMQSAFADFLYDPFKGGLDGMLKSFTNTLRKMAAEAAAAQIFEGIFGKEGKPGTGGFNFGSIFGSISGFFDGGLKDSFDGMMAEGGPLKSGKWYIAGEHGPEPIWGGGGGAFATGYAKESNISINMPVSIDARGATDRTVMQIRSDMRTQQDRLRTTVLGMKKRGEI